MYTLIPSREEDPSGLVVAALRTIAQLGVVLYMFLVGLELNTAKLGKQAHAAVAISHASIVAPFVMGAALALWLYPKLAPGGVPFTSFALFLGVAMAITAFPVLARVLTDRGLEKSDLGVIALSCAATDDVTAWCLLALVVGVAQAQVHTAFWVALWAVLFIVGMFVIVKPVARFIAEWFDENPTNSVARPGLFVMILLAALATESIGIHAVFGAFLFGVVIPHESRLARELSHQLHAVVTVLLLPAFFAVTGMNTRIGLITGWESWVTCAAIIVVATAGKYGGTLVAARMTGLDWTTSSALGVLMNTRGLMELIVLNIGLSLGVISPTLFAMMVLMALATTAATAPIFQALIPTAKEADVAEVELAGAVEA
jgi:Kef-type K+ transport system membrane component KefB